MWTIGAIATVGCKDAKRCWDDASCVQVDAGRDDTDTGRGDTDATTPGASDGGPTATTSDAIASTDDENSTSVPYTETTHADGGAFDSSVPEFDSTDTSAWSTKETPGSTAPTDATSGAPTCRLDEDCDGALVCVAGGCEVCDPSDHRGCETSEAGNRCRAAEEGNTCVACLPGDEAPISTETCGLNARGVQVLECVIGFWQTTSCDDPDECTDGQSQVGTTPCGPNGEGRYLIRCPSGSWEDDTTSCIDDDQCVNDTRRMSDIECGFSGYLEQQCVGGNWLTQSNQCLECSRKYRVPDPMFQNYLSERLGIEADPVDPNSIKYREILNLSFGSIQDVTGIQCFTALQELDLGKNQLTDLTPLASLTKLRSLNLTQSRLDDASLAPLGALTQLTSLTIDAAGVSSLEGLQPLTSLEYLRMEYNRIVDVTPLLPLTSLQSLDLVGNSELDCSSSAYSTLKARVPDFVSNCP